MLFLSHSFRDKAVVRTLAQDLEHAGFTVWLDEWRIRIGECIATAIEHAITDCRFVVLALSPHAVSSGWVDREWKAKYWMEVQDGRICVLPVIIEKCEVPLLLRTKRYVNISEDYDDGVRILVASLKDYIADDSARDFYAYAPVVAKQLVGDRWTSARNAHWDRFDRHVESLKGAERFNIQKLNSLHYLSQWGLTVTQLRKELTALGFSISTDPEFTPDLAEALESFQRTHCLRHVDGVFGELTYRQMYELCSQKRG